MKILSVGTVSRMTWRGSNMAASRNDDLDVNVREFPNPSPPIAPAPAAGDRGIPLR